MTAALFVEDRQRRGYPVEDAAEVDVDHRRPAVDVQVGNRADLADAGVVHEHVEPPEFVQRRGDQSFEVLAAGDVGAAGGDPAARVADRLDEDVEACCPACAQYDGRSAFGEQARGCRADPAARPGDNHDLAFDR